MKLCVTDNMMEVEESCALSVTVLDLNSVSSMKEEHAQTSIYQWFYSL